MSGRYGYYLRKFKPLFDSFASASSGLLSSSLFEIGHTTPIKYVDTRPIFKKSVIEIFAGRGFLFFYALDEADTSEEDLLDRRTFLLRCSERGQEICREARYFFKHVPADVLRIELDSNRLFEQYYGPSSFDPIREPHVPFVWPWQRCVEVRKEALHPREIETISLVMDIRNSSSAMLLTTDPPKFSMFIDKVVESAQDAITRHGGYFDKDTGDGVVGHFYLPPDEVDAGAVVKQALRASRSMSLKTTQLCRAYQENLSLSLAGLGCAIGLFSGKAVWLMSWKGVRAIGSSVVNASRICSNAKSGEIGYCNAIARALTSGAIGSDSFPLDGFRRQIDVSEVRGAALPEASFVKII
ncbi:adenylate/guanylate cyclase domain-containing protein [Bradyrhizobium canariense]|uniref:adenylate/guanylate cyclase domain-containing protein n=1 Tax=Bradyrhizobium canariense TaxID=255045 RepID=UPI001B89E8D3|nr:hypothetical protein [Bradyrhizobium canariense]MBR0954961.1 hypothetical protein [Bradyrhizobium canariense]